MTASADLFKHYLRRGYRKELFTAFICAVWYLVGLSMVTKVNAIFCFVSYIEFPQ